MGLATLAFFLSELHLSVVLVHFLLIVALPLSFSFSVSVYRSRAGTLDNEIPGFREGRYTLIGR